MSRFESSTFVRDENVMNQQILISTCEELGWMYVIKGDALLITDIGTEEKFYGEYDSGIRYDDKDMGIIWPYDEIGGKEKVINSIKDDNLQSFKEFMINYDKFL